MEINLQITKLVLQLNQFYRLETLGLLKIYNLIVSPENILNIDKGISKELKKVKTFPVFLGLYGNL